MTCIHNKYTTHISCPSKNVNHHNNLVVGTIYQNNTSTAPKIIVFYERFLHHHLLSTCSQIVWYKFRQRVHNFLRIMAWYILLHYKFLLRTVGAPLSIHGNICCCIFLLEPLPRYGNNQGKNRQNFGLTNSPRSPCGNLIGHVQLLLYQSSGKGH